MKINERNLCAFASTPPFDFEGTLDKRGEVNKAFQRRYFVLKGNLLFYFLKKGEREPLGVIIVEGCTIELSEESGKYCFEIAFNGDRTYVLSADSQESMEAWMKALTCAGYEYKKLVVAELQRQLEDIECAHNTTYTGPISLANIAGPMPPPRRQNPFNRPAPSLPGTNNTNHTSVEYKNGNFGPKTRRNSDHTGMSSDPAIEICPLPPVRSYKNEINRKKSYQYGMNTDTALIFISSKISGLQYIIGHTFEDLHEKFREAIMIDVLEYRSQRRLKIDPFMEL